MCFCLGGKSKRRRRKETHRVLLHCSKQFSLHTLTLTGVTRRSWVAFPLPQSVGVSGQLGESTLFLTVLLKVQAKGNLWNPLRPLPLRWYRNTPLSRQRGKD
ncbi:hypothetical protein CSUI_009973 [Cystoisospora suis]|uniref:Uncharacterized protein n=1 Tax=Cystoisospora suis TaxID=483139 RepID=A0A2C6KIJ7_9APIC|nr:hypothetical protein CSUI_009973 [Cystoisospora suis]